VGNPVTAFLRKLTGVCFHQLACEKDLIGTWGHAAVNWGEFPSSAWYAKSARHRRQISEMATTRPSRLLPSIDTDEVNFRDPDIAAVDESRLARDSLQMARLVAKVIEFSDPPQAARLLHNVQGTRNSDQKENCMHSNQDSLTRGKSSNAVSNRILSVSRMQTRFFFKPVMLVQLLALLIFTPDLPVVGPAIAPRAHAQVVVTPPCNPNPSQFQIIQNLCSYIIPPGSLVQFLNATPPTAALQQFESDTVQQFLAAHGLPASDASLLYQYGRSDLRTLLRSYMFARLVSLAVSVPAGAATVNEQAVYNWFQYQIWQFEITLYQVAVQDKNAWESNPCTWTPDPDVAQQYGLVYDGSAACNNNNSLAGLFQVSKPVPSSSYFLAAALKKVYGGLIANTPLAPAVMAQTSINTGEAFGVSAAAGATVAAIAGTAIGLNAAAIFPSSIGFATSGITLADLAGGVIAGPLAIVVLMVTAGVLAAFEVANEQQTLAELANLDKELASIQAKAPFLFQFTGVPGAKLFPGLIDPEGMFKMTAVFTALTLPDVVSTSPLPSHDPATDALLYLTPSNIFSPNLTYIDPNGVTWQAQTYKGWFVQHCTANCTGLTDSFISTLQIKDSSGTAWFASRANQFFTPSKIKPQSDDVACPANQPAPANPEKCSSYFTETVSYVDGQGNPGTFSIVGRPSITSGSDAFFTEGVPSSFAVTAAGSPPPTVTTLSSLRSGFSLTNPSPGVAQLNYDGSNVPVGSFTMQMYAADSTTSVQQTLTVHVNPAPPQFVSPTTANFIKGVPGSFTIQATGNPSPGITSGTPHFPPFDLNFVDNGNGTATISGTIPLNAPYCPGSTCSIQGFINATIGQVSTQQQLTLSVSSAVLPSLLPTGLEFVAGIPNQANIIAQGPTKGAISNVCTTLPNWLSFVDNGNNTATLSGTPQLGAPAVGLHVIVSPPGVPADVICNGGGSNYTLAVKTVPAITSGSIASFTAGAIGSFIATGVTQDVFALSGFLPEGLSFNGVAGQGTIYGAPAAGTGGVYHLRLTQGTANQDLILTVNEGPKFLNTDNATFTAGQPNSFNLLISGYPHVGILVTVHPDFPLPQGINLVETTNSLGQGTGGWMLTGTTAPGTYHIELIAQNGVGTIPRQFLTLTVVPQSPPKSNPVITWLAPQPIPFGTALSSQQLDAQANVAGTFVYAPPVGTVLLEGTQTLTATFAPTDSIHYAAATASTTISVTAPPPAKGVSIAVMSTLQRANGQVLVNIVIADTGGTSAQNVTVSTVRVSGISATPLPQNIGTVDSHATGQVQAAFPGTIGTSGTSVQLQIHGTYSGGNFGSNAKVILP
jgi:hypothetical protein